MAIMSRRNFMAGVVGTVGLGAMAIPLSRDVLHMAKYPVVNANDKTLPAHGRRVCVIGAGLAGLQTAVELCSRGYSVTVLEKSGTAGGKAKSWRDKQFGPENHPVKNQSGFKGIPRDHGVHGIWGFYDNFLEFLGRHNWFLQEIPADYSMLTFIDKDGTTRFIPKPTLPPPYDRIEQAIGFSNFADSNHRGQLLGELMKLMTFDYQDVTQRHYMDSISFEEYAVKRKMAPEVLSFFDGLMDMAYYANAKDSSALTMALICQLISGAACDIDVRTFQFPTSEKLFAPMVAYIEKLGGKIIYNAAVEKLELEDGQLKRVITEALNKSGKRIRRCAICGHVIEGDEAHDHCPSCHARGDQLIELTGSTLNSRIIEADYFVSALDTSAAQVLVTQNSAIFEGKAYFDNIMKLGVTSLFVVDLWYNDDIFWTKRLGSIQPYMAQFFATRFEYIGITVNWPFMGAAKSHKYIPEYTNFDGFSILETHVPAAERVANLSDQEIATLVHDEYKMIFNEIPAYQDYYVNRWYNYTAYRPHTEAFRPPIQSPIDNLLFVGDWVFTDHPGVYMEKTNVSSKIASNIILAKSGLADAELQILHSGVPSDMIDLLKKFVSVTET